ncbi:MAG: transketolase [Oscillospiraceae bacterium]|jgi:transketolase|nr:transketolase [Oscillospiraceae bacterium]
MALSKQEWLALEAKAHKLRLDLLETTHMAGSGHIGGGSSVLDILTIIYHKYMNIRIEDPKWEDRDRCIVSKGHAGIAYAPLLVDLGWNDPEQLKTFNLTGSKMGIHLDSNKVIGVDASTGSLGHGLSIGVGTALAARVLGKDYKTYVILGDGELDEGSNWEAAMSAAHFNTSSVITFVDRNGAMIDGPTESIMALEPLADKFTAFGFNTLRIDGHSFPQLAEAIETALAATDKPTCIICDTIKAVGFGSKAGDYRWHYGAMDDDGYEQAKKDLEAYYAGRKAKAEQEGN